MTIYTLLPGVPQQIVYAASRQRNPPITEYVITNLDLETAVYLSSADAQAQQPDLSEDLTRDYLAALQSVTVRATLDWFALNTSDDPVQVDVIPEGISQSTSALDAANAFITAGVPLLIAQELTAGGFPLVANPVALYDVSSTAPGSAILFGTQATQWNNLVSGGVTGMSTAEAINGTSEGVNGYPPAWPGGTSIPGGVTIPAVDFSPDIPSTLAGQNDTRLANFLAGAPNGAWIMPYHEVNLGQNHISGPSIQQLDNYLQPKVHAVNPTLVYVRGIATSPVNSGTDPTPWITPGMDMYSMDGYQASNANRTPNTVFDTTLNAILKVQPNAKIAIVETGTNLSVSAWYNLIATYAIQNGLVGVGSFWNSAGNPTKQTQFWNNSFAPAINAVITQLAAVGQPSGINPGATFILPPLSPSPVAGYADAVGFSYDIYINATAGVGSTNPFIKFAVRWFDNDDTSAQIVSQQQWILPMGTNGTIGTKIQGVGPQRGRYMQLRAVNDDTVACQLQCQVNSTSRTVARDDWRFEISGSPTIPGYTRAPDGGGNVNQLAGVQARSCPANGSLSYLCGLYAGRVWARFATNAPTPVINVTLTPQPADVFNGTPLFNEIIQSGSATGGDFFTELILPRAPCLITFGNSDSAAHNVFGTIITED